jgi:hypothetical protein
MTHEFDHVQAAFAASTPGRAVAGVTRAMASAWRTSRLGRVRHLAGSWRLAPASAWIRHVAVAVAVAAGLQPLAMAMLPATLRPATPAAAFVAIALLAVIAGWRAEAVAAAWHGSRLAGWLRR